MPVDLIVFDLDGTLADSLPDIAAAANYALRRLGLPEQPVTAIQGMIGGGEENFVRRLLGTGAQNCYDLAYDLYVKYYLEHCGELTRLYPGVKETLKQLTSKKLAVLSNKMGALSRLVVESMGLEDLFDLVRGGDSYGALKPSPSPLLALITELDGDPARTVMVGDKPTDVRAGQGAGAFTVGVTYGYGEPALLAEAGPHRLISRFEELLDVIG